MVISKNFIIKGNFTKFSLIKIVSFLLLLWIYDTHEKRNFDNFPGIEEKHVKIEDTVLFRSLAKHGLKEERERAKLKEKLSYDGDIKKEKFCSDVRPTYGNLRNGELNKFELYKNNYNHRYTKKKGLKKFDCYWENKIFDKFEYVNNLAEKTQISKKSFIKILLNKYTIFISLFALLPVLGIIIPYLFAYKCPKDHFLYLFIGECNTEHQLNGQPGVCKYNNITHISKDAAKAMFYLNTIFTYVSLIVVILVFVYICIKLIKYENLKGGIRNIRLKEFVRLLKNEF
ncbi:hypothetical protein PVNG_01544 [Plasmodium vivax North Korean]|uniref:Variable surface protein Vir35 n=1 Tax=Plasmodium vivax North Korean TaxID=1035514 RepID=A0A0J9U323_PLAVI|nr:hypothetical protein PVNG_01544 [Plasmodium vivax North Korean]